RRVRDGAGDDLPPRYADQRGHRHLALPDHFRYRQHHLPPCRQHADGRRCSRAPAGCKFGNRGAGRHPCRQQAPRGTASRASRHYGFCGLPEARVRHGGDARRSLLTRRGGMSMGAILQQTSRLPRVITALALCVGLSIGAKGAAAQSSLITDISSHLISVTSDFTGTELLLFGAIELDSEEVGPGTGDVLVTVRGPERKVVVRRKERVAGIWINTESVEFLKVPSFYAIA